MISEQWWGKLIFCRWFFFIKYVWPVFFYTFLVKLNTNFGSYCFHFFVYFGRISVWDVWLLSNAIFMFSIIQLLYYFEYKINIEILKVEQKLSTKYFRWIVNCFLFFFSFGFCIIFVVKWPRNDLNNWHSAWNYYS